MYYTNANMTHRAIGTFMVTSRAHASGLVVYNFRLSGETMQIGINTYTNEKATGFVVQLAILSTP